MSIKKKFCALVACVVLSSCSGGSEPMLQPFASGQVTSNLNIIRHDVIVPRSLTTTEANRLYPQVELIWREDPPGDRYVQVQRLLSAALDEGLAVFDTGRQAVLIMEVQEFHALTARARDSIGGTHAMTFRIQLRDAKNADVIYGPVVVKADLEAYGGAEAIAAENAGITQKYRISKHVAAIIQRQLIQAGMGAVQGQNLGG